MAPPPAARCTAYHLPHHVYACRTSEGVIFLHAKRDRYFGLGGPNIDSLIHCIRNWPDTTHSRRSKPLNPPSADLQRLVSILMQRGLLSPGNSLQRRRNDPGLPPLTMDPIHLSTESVRTPRLWDCLNFVLACLKARRTLRRSPLQSIAARLTTARSNNPPSDVRAALQLTQMFRRLRSLFLSEKNRCLFNALSLIYFLQHYGHFPYLVIGVKTAPFAAHSWVQQDQIILDGDPASVSHFVPILVA
jgi:hypothetical protein